MNCSTRIGVSGARPHSDRAKTKPADSNILMFVLFIQIIEYCILDCIGSLAMKFLHMNTHSVIIDV